MSSAGVVEEVRRAQARGLPIFAETCPQYLFLSSKDIDTTDLTEHDLVAIGDDVALNEFGGLQTHLFEDRVMKVGAIRIGDRATIGSLAIVLYDAEVGAELAQAAVFVKFCVVPSLNVPVAVNWRLVPFAIEELLVLMLIVCRVAGVTASAKLLDVIPVWVAVMLLEPAPTPDASPAALTLAAAVLDELHVAEFVMF